mgnify:CR=1 FL=1
MIYSEFKSVNLIQIKSILGVPKSKAVEKKGLKNLSGRFFSVFFNLLRRNPKITHIIVSLNQINFAHLIMLAYHVPYSLPYLPYFRAKQ